MNPSLLSVVIISFNEEDNIARCIDSVESVADEIIVLDSFSTDKTVEISESKGALVKQEVFKGHIEQKNRALELASNSFVLSLDADEALDTELLEAIKKEKMEFTHQAYTMNRCANYCGKFIHHGSWYPDKKLRLFNKQFARWGGMNPHDKVELKENLPVKHLKGDILHFSYNSVEEHILQCNKFSSISAHSLFIRGKKSNLFKILFNPWWAFVNGYILRLGFLDGFYGLVISLNYAHQTFQKYVKLYQLHAKAGK